MSRYTISIARLMLVCLALTACEVENTPENNFDIYWEDFDFMYAQFEHKGVDWNEVYDILRPEVGPSTTDDALFSLLSDAAARLNDSHIRIYGDGRFFESGIVGKTAEDDFELDVVRRNYLAEARQSGENNFTYGWVTDRVGYVHFTQMSGDNEDWLKGIDDALAYLAEAEALVVDIRGNLGGEDADAYQIAGRFADKRRAAMKTKYRNGPDHDDFGPTKTWYVAPAGPRRFTGPIILLTNTFTMSAAENFIFALSTMPYVTQMGSTTAGACANTLKRELLNGWFYTVPIGFFSDLKGHSVEGKGFVPAKENQVVNTPEDLQNGIDTVLESAIGRLTDRR